MAKQSMEFLFGTDKAKEKDGIVIQYGSTLRVRLARAGGANTEFAVVMEEERRPYQRLIANELLPEDLAKQILHRAYARGIVREWGGMDDGGVDVPFSVDECVKQFEKYPDFFQFVFQESARLANYRVSTREDEVKNS